MKRLSNSTWVALAGGKLTATRAFLAALEDDGDAGSALQLLIEGFDPLLTGRAPLGGLDDLQMPLLGEGLNEVVVVGGNGPEVGGASREPPGASP